MNPRRTFTPTSTGREGEGIPSETQEKERAFRLNLTIQDKSEFEGLHVAIALADEEGKSTPVLAVIAGGVPASDEGAGLVADMLRDAADAIDEHLGKERPHTDTAAMPVVKRPRFNPRPMGAQR